MNPRSRSQVTSGLLVLALVLISGCGDPLDSRYGVSDPGSINGCAVLHDLFKSRSNLRDAEVIGPRLQADGELLIHVVRYASVPDDEACEWLKEWLNDRDGRQAVLILRGGTLTTWLCRRWAAEARAEAQRLPIGAAQLEALAERLDQRAAAEDDSRQLDTDDGTCPLFTLKRRTAVVPGAITGLGLTKVPLAMRITGSLTIAGAAVPDQPDKTPPAIKPDVEADHRAPAKPVTTVKPTATSDDDDDDDKGDDKDDDKDDDKNEREVESLITLSASTGAGGVEAATSDVPWAVAITYGESRLVVVLDALPLLDGAQPDPAARALLTALVDEVTGFHGDNPHTTWVSSLRIRGEGGPPNPMLAVLTSAPISYISWHFVVFLVVLALAGAAWLGRREAPSETRHDRFSHHVLALAARLRDGAYAAWCARAIARAALRHRKPPPALLDADEARRWLLSLTDSATDVADNVSKTRPPASPPSASPRGSP